MSATLAPLGEPPACPAFAGLNGLCAGEPPIDLVHLARQTDNDAALEEELLVLFDRQSASLLAQMAAEDAPPRRRADAAHMVRGSALAVGAWPVARAAQALETSLGCGNAEKADVDRAVAALAEAIGEARAAIARLRG